MAVRRLQVEPPRPPEGEGREILRAAYYDQMVLDKLRAAIGGDLKDILDAIPSGDLQPDQVVVDYVTDRAKAFVPNIHIDNALTQKLTYSGLRLYLTLATREGFSWEQQLDTAKATIARVNVANDGLNLQTDYELPPLINALATQNNPEQLMANLELMKDPRLVIAPTGLALNHLVGPLTVPRVAPYIDDQFTPDTARTKTAVYLIDAGDLININTQPEAVKQAANGDSNRLTDHQLRKIALDSGIKLDEHGYGLLAAMLRQQDPQTKLDTQSYSTFTNEFANVPNIVARGNCCFGYYDFNAFVSRLPASVSRLRVSVMAEL